MKRNARKHDCALKRNYTPDNPREFNDSRRPGSDQSVCRRITRKHASSYDGAFFNNLDPHDVAHCRALCDKDVTRSSSAKHRETLPVRTYLFDFAIETYGSLDDAIAVLLRALNDASPIWADSADYGTCKSCAWSAAKDCDLQTLICTRLASCRTCGGPFRSRERDSKGISHTRRQKSLAPILRDPSRFTLDTNYQFPHVLLHR